MITSQSFAGQAYAIIKKDILTCVLDPGSKIAQPELVKRYDFGITPIREALKRLEQEGLVKSMPRFGYLISPITIQDVEDIFELRMILEKSAVQMAIECATDEQLASIMQHANFTYIYKDRETYLIFLEQNISFHRAIALAAGNRRLADMLTIVLGEMTRPFNLGLDLRDSAEEMRREHIAIATTLVHRDVKGAEQTITAQITRSRERVVEMLNKRLKQIPIQEIMP
jgi:DNA-binding GntR family transcriptional regulator